LIVVISGFVGRYIYTAVPRTADGMVWEEHLVKEQIEALEISLESMQSNLPEGVVLADLMPGSQSLTRFFRDVRAYFNRRRIQRDLGRDEIETLEKMVEAHRRSLELRRSLSTLATARKLLAVWHTVHIPLGMALFVTAFVHIGAALYYATLLR
jgi:hypothetical protein